MDTHAHPRGRQVLTFQGAYEEFLRSTTAHSLKPIGWSKRKTGRYSWLLLFVVTLCLFAWLLYEHCQKYFDKTVHTRVKKVIEFPTFPAVTICDVNPIRLASIPNTKLDPFYEFSENGDFKITAVDAPAAYPLQRQIFVSALETISLQQRQAHGHDMRSLIIHCSFSGRECNLDEDFIASWNNNYGNCFTFNGGMPRVFTRPLKLSQRPGPLFGLRLILNLDGSNYLPSYTQTQGARIVIHPHFAMPVPEDGGFSVAPGTLTTVGLSLTQYNRLGPPYGKCIAPNSTNMYGYFYSRTACRQICLQQQLIFDCLCTDPALPLSDKFATCDLSNLNPANKQLPCHDSVMKSFASGDYSCDCPPLCAELSYNNDNTHAAFPATDYQRTLAQLLNPWLTANKLFDAFGNFDLSNLTAIDVYFKDISLAIITEAPEITILDFFSQVGGASALLLGVSFLTVFEVLELALTLVVMICANLNPWPEEMIDTENTHDAEDEDSADQMHSAGISFFSSKRDAIQIDQRAFSSYEDDFDDINRRPLPNNSRLQRNIIIASK